MKNFSKFLTIAIMLMAFGAAANAQVSATASAAATIVSPIAISKTTDMNFGNVAPSAAGGTVVLSPAGVRTPSGVTLPAVTGTVTAATFNVTGTAGYVYTITLPAAATTISDGLGHSMTINTWTSNPTPTGTLAAGPNALNVGATLTVGAAQVPGIYNTANAGGSGDFTVTVNYN